MKQKILKFLYNFLAYCAKIYIARHKIKIVAITGSVGKTSCRMVVTQVLKQISSTPSNLPLMKGKGKDYSEKKIYTSPKNYNSELGLVFSVFQIEEYHPSVKNLLKLSGKILLQTFFGKKNTDILIAEYGIDAPDDMDHLLKIATPDIAILTKLDAVHSGNFPRGVEQYWQEKWKLLLAAKKVYLNLGDEFSQKNISLLTNYQEIFGKNIPHATLIKNDENTPVYNFYYQGENIFLNLLGKENIVYTCLALDIAKDFSIKNSESELRLYLKLQPGRFSFFEYKNALLLDSSYNAAPESMKLVLENMQEIGEKLYPEYKKIAVLGDMRELGETTQKAHENLAELCQDFSEIFTVGPNMFQYFIPKLQNLGFSGEIHSSLSSREIGKKLKTFLKTHETQKFFVLFKGSQNTIFTEEALAEVLPKKEQKNLVRQSPDWKKKKQEFFRSL